MTGRRGANPAIGTLELMVEVLRELPRLEHAACIGQPDLFDAERPGDLARARKICSSCPCRQPCSDWAKDRRDLTGVVAGELRSRHTPKPRRRKARHDDTE